MIILITKKMTWDRHPVAHEPRPIPLSSVVHAVAALRIEDSIWVQEQIAINIFKISNAD